MGLTFVTPKELEDFLSQRVKPLRCQRDVMSKGIIAMNSDAVPCGLYMYLDHYKV